MDMQEITVSRTKEYRQYESFKQKNVDVLLDSESWFRGYFSFPLMFADFL